MDFSTDFSDVNLGSNISNTSDLKVSNLKIINNDYKPANSIDTRFVDYRAALSLKDIPPITPVVNSKVNPEINSDKLAVADIFPSIDQAKYAANEMQRQGLDADQISIVAKDYSKLGSINWEMIAASGMILSEILTELGISDRATTQYVDGVEQGKFLVIATGDDWEIRKAQYVLNNISNWQFIEYFKTIITLSGEVQGKYRSKSIKASS